MKNHDLVDVSTEEMVSHGEVYCARRCGASCKRSRYELAMTQAQALALELGTGWRGYVWDNLGWHWQVRKGKMAVHPSVTFIGGVYRIHGYTAFFNNSFSQVVCSGETAQEAIEEALAEAHDGASCLMREIADVHSSVVGEEA